MSPVEITPESNPLRLPSDRRLNRIAGPSGLIIFGVTGDLSRKKLMPAVYDLANRGLLPPGFALVGFARRDWEDQDFEQVVHDAVKQYARTPFDEDVWNQLKEGIRFVQGEFDDDAAFDAAQGDASRSSIATAARWATTRSTSRSRPSRSRRSPSSSAARGSPSRRTAQWRRVVIEKPFGSDLKTARELNDVVETRLPARQRVPHRPLPRQGDRAEHPGAALRQPALRADLERQLRRPRADHHGRGHRRRRPCRLLRRHRRRARRHPEPPAAAARPHRDGGAGLVRRRRPARREGEGALGRPPARGPRRRAPPAASTPAAGRAARRSSASSTRTA